MAFARHTEVDFTAGMREHPEAYVPHGMYCYTRVEEPEADGRRGGPIKVCPFWDAERDMPDQDYGYCWLNHKSDWGCMAEELDRPWNPAAMLEGQEREMWLEMTGGIVPEGWAGRTYREWVLGYVKAFNEDDDKDLGHALLYGLRVGDGLLWDQVKLCGINDD